MDTILQSQVFFFISSVGFVILGVVFAIFLFYLIRATRTFSRVMSRLEQDIDTIGDVSKEMLEEVRESTIFKFLFKKKRKQKKD